MFSVCPRVLRGRAFAALIVALAVMSAHAQVRDFWTPPLVNDADDLAAYLMDGWLGPDSAHMTSIGATADVGIVVSRAGAFDATFDGSASARTRRLRVTIDGSPIGPPDLIAVSSGAKLTLPIGTLSAGEHRMRLESLDGADPISASDTRRVSFTVRRLTVSRVGG